MNSRRGSTLSPMRMRKRSSAAPASSMLIWQERAVGGVEGGVAELFGVHFAQAFEAGDLQALFAGGADGGEQAAEVFEAGVVLAAAERVAAALRRRCALAGSGLRSSKPSLVRSASAVLIVRTSCSSTMCSRGRCGSVAGGVAVGARRRRLAGRCACRRRRSARRRLLLPGGDEVVELARGW